MPSPAQCGPFTGTIFEIVAGPEQKLFHAHASILLKSSKLKAIVEGEWKDSKDARIVLEDWDEETVARMLEWLYTGEYNEPVFEASDSVSETPSPAEVERLHDDTVDATARVKNLTDELSFTRPLTPIWALEFNTSSDQRIESSRSFHGFPFNNQTSCLPHAKVYALADYMLLPELQAMAYEALRDALILIGEPKPNLPVISDLVLLVEYVYGNTRWSQNEEEPMRKLVTTFIAADFDRFCDKEGGMQRLMEQGGDIAGDVWEKVGRKEAAWRKELAGLREKVAKFEAREALSKSKVKHRHQPFT